MLGTQSTIIIIVVALILLAITHKYTNLFSSTNYKFKFKLIESGRYLSVPSAENKRWLGDSTNEQDYFEFLDSDLTNTRIKHIPSGKLLISGTNNLSMSNDGLPAWVIGIDNGSYICGSERWCILDKNIKSNYTRGYINIPNGYVRTHNKKPNPYEPQLDSSVSEIEFEK